MSRHPTILGIDPGTRFMGVAVIRGPELLDYGVHQLRNGERADDLLAHGKEVLFSIIRDHNPAIVAIEAPYLSRRTGGLLLLGSCTSSPRRRPGTSIVELALRYS